MWAAVPGGRGGGDGGSVGDDGREGRGRRRWEGWEGAAAGVWEGEGGDSVGWGGHRECGLDLIQKNAKSCLVHRKISRPDNIMNFFV